jgi:hypothetical protein
MKSPLPLPGSAFAVYTALGWTADLLKVAGLDAAKSGSAKRPHGILIASHLNRSVCYEYAQLGAPDSPI